MYKKDSCSPLRGKKGPRVGICDIWHTAEGKERPCEKGQTFFFFWCFFPSGGGMCGQGSCSVMANPGFVKGLGFGLG